MIFFAPLKNVEGTGENYATNKYSAKSFLV